MLAIERRNEILFKLQEDKKVVVSDLSQLYNVTEETIRRDLEKLENQGLVKKTYGGAILNESFNIDLPYTIRERENIVAKQCIAEKISNLIEDGNHILMDSSSTSLFVAKNIKHKKNITLITNSIEIILEVSDKVSWKILSTGGILKENSLSLVGYQAERTINTFNVDLAVFSCKGIDLEKGITDSNESDAQIKKALLKSSKRSILAIDSSKFDKISFTKVGDISDVDIIVTENEPNERWRQKCHSSGVKLIYG